MRLNPQTNRQEKVGGVKYTIKDGIVYDAQKLLAEVAAAVAAEKTKTATTHRFTTLVPTVPRVPMVPKGGCSEHQPLALLAPGTLGTY